MKTLSVYHLLLLLLVFIFFTHSYLFNDVKNGEKYNDFDEPKEMQKFIIMIKWYRTCMHLPLMFVCLIINQGTLNKFTRNSKTRQNEINILNFLKNGCSYNQRCILLKYIQISDRPNTVQKLRTFWKLKLSWFWYHNVQKMYNVWECDNQNIRIKSRSICLPEEQSKSKVEDCLKFLKSRISRSRYLIY